MKDDGQNKYNIFKFWNTVPYSENIIRAGKAEDIELSSLEKRPRSDITTLQLP